MLLIVLALNSLGAVKREIGVCKGHHAVPATVSKHIEVYVGSIEIPLAFRLGRSLSSVC
jgi:hypothetical protein